MKKILLSVVCLVMVGMQSVNAQVAIAALHQAGKVTIFPAGALQSAIDASVAGDTIYLSEGIFGGFAVEKPIKIIGAGQTTQISGGITLGSYGITIGEGLSLSGLNCLQYVDFNGRITGARISQCKIGGTCYFYNSDENNFDNIEIVTSQMNSLQPSSPVKGLAVVASKIDGVSMGGNNDGSVTILNCNINSTTGSSPQNTYVNCIINSLGQGVYQNCLYKEDYYENVVYECYQSDGFTLDDDLNCSMSDEQLQAAGYVGQDNTWVGIGGGEVKFSLVMPGVQVVEHTIGVNQQERKLNVTLKFGNK